MNEINEEIRLAVLRGRADERERIIKLLETVCVERGKSWGGYCTLPIDPEHCQECRATFDYIALIKGRNGMSNPEYEYLFDSITHCSHCGVEFDSMWWPYKGDDKECENCEAINEVGQEFSQRELDLIKTLIKGETE